MIARKGTTFQSQILIFNKLKSTFFLRCKTELPVRLLSLQSVIPERHWHILRKLSRIRPGFLIVY
jgi:hypothetical protein